MSDVDETGGGVRRVQQDRIGRADERAEQLREAAGMEPGVTPSGDDGQTETDRGRTGAGDRMHPGSEGGDPMVPGPDTGDHDGDGSDVPEPERGAGIGPETDWMRADDAEDRPSGAVGSPQWASANNTTVGEQSSGDRAADWQINAEGTVEHSAGNTGPIEDDRADVAEAEEQLRESSDAGHSGQDNGRND